MSERKYTVTVKPLPAWVDASRLLGVEAISLTAEPDGTRTCAMSLSGPDAADVAARLRAIGIDGRAIEVAIKPPLSRSEVRDGRTRDARARRDTTPGFTRREARASGEGHYSLTPDVLALELGRLASGRSVVDACSGSGGNAIGFARAGSSVTAIEIDAERLTEAQHNARVYGVEGRIRFVLGDARETLRAASADILFVDPPWGREFDKKHTEVSSFPLLKALLELPLRFTELWLKLPMSFATNTLEGLGTIDVIPFFGKEKGDFHRIKFLLIRIERSAFHHAK